MDALSGGAAGNGGLWGWKRPPLNGKSSDSSKRSSKPSDSAEAAGRTGYQFPLKQALTAGSLALAGDTIAQVRERWRRRKQLHRGAVPESDSTEAEDVLQILFSEHDWLRSLRMTSYGFLFYGPGSYLWYQYLDRSMPKQTIQNIMLKVLLNQIVLGPCVIAVVFAWNNLWQGKLSQLPDKYQKDALSTLLFGFRFWIPVSAINFWVIPLQARVAFMSLGSIFWNFCLSTTMSK
ncbi:protein Mpv17 isoform X1 [Punica granatum]|nr:protein Mpv17 isoform X1 [Punica granatum]XP_031383702.1 protein Mpv17 isoform X1 [Punica granatum]